MSILKSPKTMSGQSQIEMYEHFDVFMKLCTSFDDCIFVSKMQKTCDTCKLGL